MTRSGEIQIKWQEEHFVTIALLAMENDLVREGGITVNAGWDHVACIFNAMWRTTAGIRQVTGHEMQGVWHGRWEPSKQTIWRTRVLRLPGYFSYPEMVARAVLRMQIKLHTQVLGINLGNNPLSRADSAGGFTISYPAGASDKVGLEWNLGRGWVFPGAAPFGTNTPAAPVGGWPGLPFIAPPPQAVQQAQMADEDEDDEE